MNEVTAAEPQANVGGVQVSLQSVYLKDCSYESPNGPRLPSNQPWEPKFQLNMNTSTEELSPEAREVLLTVTVEAKQGDTTLYLVEVKQAGLFTISGASIEDLKRLIGSFCPAVLFPYAREVISDLIVKGGFPNFLLPLVNFDAPGDSPNTTAKVFFDTLPGDFPPRAMIASSASSRVRPSRVPVTTTDLPARV